MLTPFKATIASNKLDANGNIFSEEALKQLAETAPLSFLSHDFFQVLNGRIDESRVTEEKKVEIRGMVELPVNQSTIRSLFNSGNLYFVPAYSAENFTMYECSLVTDPADKTLTPVSWDFE